MPSLLVVVTLCLLAIGQSASVFESYVAKYEKSYAKDPTEFVRRKAVFEENVKAIDRQRKELIKQGVQPWMGVNEFTDMTPDEFKQSGRIQARSMSAQAAARSCLANGVEVDLSTINVGAAPASFDWRTQNVVSPVQNQEQCGSCWAFATASVIESAWAIKHNNLTKLSEQEIVDCSTACVLEDGQSVCNQGCNGGWPWAAMSDVITWGGLETEAVYPYNGVAGTCGRKDPAFDAITNYTCLSGPALADETVMAAFLAANGPLAIAMDAGILQSYRKGIIEPGRIFDSCSKTSLDHAIVLVGYGSEGKKDFWIVRNSWGPTWGEDGYFRIERGAGACGLNAGVVFPISA